MDTREVVEEDIRFVAVAVVAVVAVAVVHKLVVVVAVHTVNNTCRWVVPSVTVGEREEDCWKQQCVLLLVWMYS